MPIIFHENEKVFHLFNKEISYIIKVSKNQELINLYFGKKLKDRENFILSNVTKFRDMSVYPFVDDRDFSLEHQQLEYPSFGHGDMRQSGFSLSLDGEDFIPEFKFKTYKFYQGKPALKDLPATYCNKDEDATTLEICLYDELLDANLILLYTIFEKLNVITRSVQIQSNSKEFTIDKALSFNLDLFESDYQLTKLTGAWARERHIHTQNLDHGIYTIESLRGHSSHNFNPFLCLSRKETNEFNGECIGCTLIYSGNFVANVQVDTYDTTRIQMGIHPDTFKWNLNENEVFQTPEAILVYSDSGLNNMSQTFHALFDNNLIRSKYKNKPRPILINNWEATYFDFNEEKLLDIAKEAKELGIELFVLDDGWFLNRNDDHHALGDWIVDPVKFPNGLNHFVSKVKNLGLDFGLWIEPEMVSEKSNLYTEHPEWALHVENRHLSVGRNQYVLDFSNPEVVEYIFDQLKNVFSSIDLSYVKWDMNRSLSEVKSSYYPNNQQGEIYHRFILGVYSLYEKLIHEFPDILFESCASGGARFDAGMLYYAPQAWTSDNNDAIERLKIQYGTSMLYPVSSMGAHVAAVPNHQLFRITSLKTRANVAHFGTFGYELDPTKLSSEEKETIKEQVKFMKSHRELLQFGNFYRLKSPFENNSAAWMTVSKDKNHVLVGYYRILQKVNYANEFIKLSGLDPDKKYRMLNTDQEFYGDELMYFGINVSGNPNNEGDFMSNLYEFEGIE